MTPWVSRYQKGETSLDLNEARDDGVLGCSGISWTICKRSVLNWRCRLMMVINGWLLMNLKIALLKRIGPNNMGLCCPNEDYVPVVV